MPYCDPEDGPDEAIVKQFPDINDCAVSVGQLHGRSELDRYVGTKHSDHQHAVTIGIKTIALFHGVPVGGKHQIRAAECADQE